MNYFKSGFAIVLIVGTASCATGDSPGGYGMSGSDSTVRNFKTSGPPTMEPSRTIDERDCTRPFMPEGGNLVCR